MADGRIFDRYSSPVVGKNGSHYGRIWTFRDITERKRSEDTLQQLSAAVDQSPVSVVITDPQGNISYVNRKFTETAGYTSDEVVGKNPRILNSGQSSPDHYRNLWSTITQGREWHGEFCNKRKNGEIYWESASIRPITNDRGGITHFLAIKEDITERRHADELLKASEKRYRLLFERNLAGVLRTTLEGQVIECNQAAARMFGYDSPDEVLVLSAVSLFSQSSDREALLSRLKSERNLTNLEIKCRRKNGESVWVIANLSFAEDDSLAGGTIESTLIDITERKRAEERVRELLDSIPEAIYAIDLEARCTSCNPSCLQLVGYEQSADLLGKDMHCSSTIPGGMERITPWKSATSTKPFGGDRAPTLITKSCGAAMARASPPNTGPIPFIVPEQSFRWAGIAIKDRQLEARRRNWTATSLLHDIPDPQTASTNPISAS